MKKVIIVNGAMGVGKTTVCKILCNKLKKSAFLDGDWCFDLHPFIANKETKAMAIDNITHMIDNYLRCSDCEYVVLCWVIDKESMYEQIIRGLSELDFNVLRITLTCNHSALENRWFNDKINDWRTNEWLEVSKKSLDYFEGLESIKINTSIISPNSAADQILNIINKI